MSETSAGVRFVDPAVLPRRADEPSGWLVGPWFDALLIANIAWPLLLLAQRSDGFGGREGLQFWQVYYVTTPHRWITLLLVFLDRERFHERRGAFLAVAAGVAAACAGIHLATGTLTCLLALDYLWNGWHFAAQHHGIYRIYERSAHPQRTAGLVFDKWAMRAFLLYVILRVASATWSSSTWDHSMRLADGLAVAIPVWLIISDLVRQRGNWRGQTTYLVSVLMLYLSLLWAVHKHRPALVLSLATASALFHAVEYLALVAWSVRGRHARGADRMGLLGHLVPRWGLTLGVFMLVLGAGGWLMDQHWMRAWLMINVVVAFLHYAYDGMIWRRPRGSP